MDRGVGKIEKTPKKISDFNAGGRLG